VETLAAQPTIARMAMELLGAETVRLYQDASFWKLPGSRKGSWHSDLNSVPLDTEQFITAWVTLGRSEPSNGCLEYATTSHKKGSLQPGSHPVWELHLGDDTRCGDWSAVKTVANASACQAQADAVGHHYYSVREVRVANCATFSSCDNPEQGKAGWRSHRKLRFAEVSKLEDDDVRSAFKVWSCSDPHGEGFDSSSGGPLQPGDIVFHHGRTLHRSQAHQGLEAKIREAIALRYVTDGVEVLRKGEQSASGHTLLDDDAEANRWWKRGPMADIDELPVMFSKQHWWSYSKRGILQEKKDAAIHA